MLESFRKKRRIRRARRLIHLIVDGNYPSAALALKGMINRHEVTYAELKITCEDLDRWLNDYYRLEGLGPLCT